MRKFIDYSMSVTNRTKSMDILFQDIKRATKANESNEKLFALYQATKKKAYKDKIVVANMPFVVSLAKQYQHQGLSLEDLIEEGSIGLMVCIDNFDMDMGNEFTSYAVHYITKYINIALCNKSRVVRLPFNRICEGAEINHSSLNDKLGDSEDGKQEFGDMLSDSYYNANAYDNEQTNNYMANNYLSFLPKRDQEIVRLHFGIGKPRKYSNYEIARRFGLTDERVRQIVLASIEKLRNLK